MKTISEVLDYLKKQIGIDLKPCEHFKGIQTYNGRKYFNVVLSERISESKEFEKLKRFEKKYKILTFEPNGVDRVSVFF